MKDFVVVLEITSFIGMSLGASHYYGKLYGYKDNKFDSVELVRTLNAKDAKILNKKWDQPGLFEAEDEASVFDTKDEIRTIAINSYKTHFPDAIILLEGRVVNAEPQLVIDAPIDFKVFVNNLWLESEKLSWGKNYKQKEELFVKYHEYLDDYEKKLSRSHERN